MKPSAKSVFAGTGFAFVLVAVMANATANSATLTNDLITVEYDQQTALGTNRCANITCFNPVTFTVGPGIEISGHVGAENIDFSDHALTITFLQRSNFASMIFNGFVFTVISGNPFDQVGSVSGLAPLLVSEPNGQLAINLQGLTFDVGAQIVVTFANETPLPGALPLFATGLGALGLLGWRRKQAAIAA
jgi:hypothetical protein